jgi:TonB family protein
MNPSTVSLLLEYGIRSTLLLAITFLAASLLRRRSSAWRHVVWFAGLMTLLVLPAAQAWTPKWASESTVFAAPLRTVVNVVAYATPEVASRKQLDWLLILWLSGTALLLIRFALSSAIAARLARSSEPWLDGARISSGTRIPLVCGLWRPVIVLPQEAVHWTESRRQSVMRHENMHISRWDTGSQALAQLACALYWPQPLVWLAASQLRTECEHACDDGVLVTGTKASVYAEDLMEIARGLNESLPIPATTFAAGGIAMTRTHQLEGRISALLNPRKDRRQAGAGFAASVTALALTLVVSLAALRTPLFAQQGKLTGTIRDASGALVPRARVDLKNHDPKAKFHEIAYTNDAGEYSFENVPDSGYDISVSKPGFARLEQNGVRFESARSGRMDMTLGLGMIQERLTVSGATDADLFARKVEAEMKAKQINLNGEPVRLQIGGNVQAAKVDHKVTPLYPPGAKADRVEGTVLMAAVIGIDGSVMSLEQVNKQVDSRLAQAAMDAVKQWHYQPTLLNGNPVEIVTQIEVNFTLMR